MFSGKCSHIWKDPSGGALGHEKIVLPGTDSDVTGSNGSKNVHATGTLPADGLTDVLFHELKQPLLCVLVLAERLERNIDEMDPGATPKHAPLKRDIVSLLSSVNQIRELLLAGTNFVTGKYVEDGWGTKMTQAWHSLGALGIAREVRVVMEGNLENLSSGPDPKLLNQILSNLVLNAIEALEQVKSQKQELLLEFQMDPKLVVFRVHDSGNGVPQEFLEKIFERGHTTKANVGGSGIGLWLCRMIAHSLGGSLVVQTSSRLGGACFELRVPREQEQNLGVVA